LHAQEETRPADAAHENGDLHIADTKPLAPAASVAVLDCAFSSSRKRSSAPSPLRASAHRRFLLFAQALIGDTPGSDAPDRYHKMI